MDRFISFEQLGILATIPVVLFFGYGLLAAEKELPVVEPAPIEIEAVRTLEEGPKDLLPDLVPLPAADLILQKSPDGSMDILFSATYFNQGDGAMELVADPETAGIPEDIERDVFQRIFTDDGEYRDELVGNFMWHQEHLHYHFVDFMEYDLRLVDAPGDDGSTGDLIKSTFCVRDVSRVELSLPNREDEAVYTVCWKERQGISVGWGDTYYYNYPDQNIDVTDLPTGMYHLTLRVNPEGRLVEKNYQNNESWVRFWLDQERDIISVLTRYPHNSPHVEHVHLDDPFGI